DIPREPPSGRPVAVGVAFGIDPLVRERLPPRVDAEMLGPSVEARAHSERALEDRSQPAVAARERAFEKGRLAFVVLEPHPAPDARRDAVLLPVEVLDAILPQPLERRHVLRDERRRRQRDLRTTAFRRSPPDREVLVREIDEPGAVGFGPRRRPDQEVDLDEIPPRLERQAARVQDLRLVEILVDDVAQALRAGLGGDREPRLADASYL